MPWGILVREIIEYVVENVPQGGTVLDLLCGTGYLLGELQQKRPDISFVGVDLESEFIEYAKKRYPGIGFVVGDAMTWGGDRTFDSVLCTGGLHHLSYEKQEEFIRKISQLVKPEGFAIVGDPYIDSYTNENERKAAATKLGNEYLAATMHNGAPDDVIKATASLIENDVLLVEFKDSLENVEPYFKKAFSSVEKHKTWPKADTQYGDYYFVLRK